MEAKLSARAVRRLYDRLAPTYDWLTAYEAEAVRRGIELLDLRPGQVALNVGVGTGREHDRIVQAVAPDGLALALDSSPAMLNLARRRAGGQMCQADAAALPLRDGSIDRLFASYLLDLLPSTVLAHVLEEFRRVLSPDGRLVLVSLTEGFTPLSRLVISAWRVLYAISPIMCGGCRPLQLSGLLASAGLQLTHRVTLVQLGVPTEIVAAAHG